jgi:hypothetical protein
MGWDIHTFIRMDRSVYDIEFIITCDYHIVSIPPLDQDYVRNHSKYKSTYCALTS